MLSAIFLDIETTGLDPIVHRSVEIAFKIINVATGEVRGSYQTVIKQSGDIWEKRDLTSVEINGFTWELISQGKDAIQVSSEIIDLFTQLNIQRGKAVFICQNPAFDRGFFTQLVNVYTQERLNWPYHWLDFASMYWALLVHRSIQEKASLPQEFHLSKNEIAKSYNLPEEVSPHRAMNGVEHLVLCYQNVVGFAGDRKRDNFWTAFLDDY